MLFLLLLCCSQQSRVQYATRFSSVPQPHR